MIINTHIALATDETSLVGLNFANFNLEGNAQELMNKMALNTAIVIAKHEYPDNADKMIQRVNELTGK